MFMTEGQRDYLADLAGRKGERLRDTSNVSVAWASAEIERLKSLPDTSFANATPQIEVNIEREITKNITEVSKWTFQE